MLKNIPGEFKKNQLALKAGNSQLSRLIMTIVFNVAQIYPGIFKKGILKDFFDFQENLGVREKIDIFFDILKVAETEDPIEADLVTPEFKSKTDKVSHLVVVGSHDSKIDNETVNSLPLSQG